MTGMKGDKNKKPWNCRYQIEQSLSQPSIKAVFGHQTTFSLIFFSGMKYEKVMTNSE